MVMTAVRFRTVLFSLCFFGCLGLSIGHTNPYFTPVRKKKPSTRKAVKKQAKAVKATKTPVKKRYYADGHPAIPKSLRVTMKHSITLLKAKKYRDFFKLYTKPEELKKFKDILDKVVAGFGRQAGQVQKSLAFALQSKPTIQGNIVTFKVPVPSVGKFPPRMRFEKQGTRWYLLDN